MTGTFGMEKHPFPDLGIEADLLKAIESLGFEQPSPIQEQAIPVALGGRDVVGQSQTGSGKTMAFAIPALQRLKPNLRGVQALILCPTRELAIQVCAEVHKFTAFKQGVRATPVYGGASYDRQIRALESGSQIVVGTPGRVIDFIERGLLRLENLQTLVFDEADEMLDMGFRDEIERVMKVVPKERQTIFFSATFTPAIRHLIANYTNNPVTITIEHKALTVPTVEQRYYEVQGRSKTEVLCRLLDMESPRLSIVFANTKKMVDDVTDALVARGFSADRLHGDLNQIMRDRVMRNFRTGTVEVLVATDVAARGLDVEHVDLIVNYDLPYDEEDYVHRIGRTGRAGRTGMAINLVAGRDIYLLQRIQRYINIRILRCKVPSQDEMENRRADQLFERVKALLEEGTVKTDQRAIDRLIDAGFDSTAIASALLHLLSLESTCETQMIPEDRATRPAERNDRPRPNREAPVRERPAPRPFAADTFGQKPAADQAPQAAAPTPAITPPVYAPEPEVREGSTAEASDSQNVEAPAPMPAPQPVAQPSNEVEEAPTPEEGIWGSDAASDGPVREDRPQRDWAKKEPRVHERRASSNSTREGMARLFINVGAIDGARPGDIAGVIYNTTQLAPGSLGAIDIRDRSSYVEVPEEFADQVLSKIEGAMMRGRELRMDWADGAAGGGAAGGGAGAPPRRFERRDDAGPRRFDAGRRDDGPRRDEGPRRYDAGRGDDRSRPREGGYSSEGPRRPFNKFGSGGGGGFGGGPKFGGGSKYGGGGPSKFGGPRKGPFKPGGNRGRTGEGGGGDSWGGPRRTDAD